MRDTAKFLCYARARARRGTIPGTAFLSDSSYLTTSANTLGRANYLISLGFSPPLPPPSYARVRVKNTSLQLAHMFYCRGKNSYLHACTRAQIWHPGEKTQW